MLTDSYSERTRSVLFADPTEPTDPPPDGDGGGGGTNEEPNKPPPTNG